jgi:hypothetical protein
MIEADIVVYWNEVAAVLGIGVGVVGSGGVIYLLFNNERSRTTDSIRKALEQWHGPGLREGRKLVAAQPDTEALIRSVRQARDEGSEAYFLYQRHLDFFEALGVAHRKSGRGLSALQGMLGNTVLEEWARWEPVIGPVWGDSQYSYPNFKQLVANLERFRHRAAAWAAMRRFLKFFVTSDYGRYPI